MWRKVTKRDGLLRTMRGLVGPLIFFEALRTSELDEGPPPQYSALLNALRYSFVTG